MQSTENDGNDVIVISDANGAAGAHYPSTASTGGDTSATETDLGYESSGSRGSSHSGSSATSGGFPRRKHHHQHHQHKREPAPSPSSMQPVIIANFQPVIEPLEKLELDCSNVFEPLLDADPWEEIRMKGGETTEGDGQKEDLGVTEAEWEGR